MTEQEEQAQINLEGEQLRRLKEMSEWKLAKEKLLTMIAMVMSMETLTDYKTASSLQLEITARKRAAGLVKAWIEEVEGSGEQKVINQPLKEKQSELITRFEEE